MLKQFSIYYYKNLGFFNKKYRAKVINIEIT